MVLSLRNVLNTFLKFCLISASTFLWKKFLHEKSVVTSTTHSFALSCIDLLSCWLNQQPFICRPMYWPAGSLASQLIHLPKFRTIEQYSFTPTIIIFLSCSISDWPFYRCHTFPNFSFKQKLRLTWFIMPDSAYPQCKNL